MSNEEGRRTDDVRMLIKTLAFYVHRGYPLSISFTIQDPRAFDAIRWELIKVELRTPRLAEGR